MAKAALRGVVLVAITAVVLWAIWAATGRVQPGSTTPQSGPPQFVEWGRDTGRGNMLAVQPWVTPRDYASADALHSTLGEYLDKARKKGWLSAGTIAVFPEYTGTWLVASGEKESAISSTTLTSAMTTVALTHLPEFAYYLATAPSVQDAAKWALFSVKATGMARDYQTVFGELSRRFGIHIVAGSIVLPDPQVVNGQLVVRPGGSMVNVSAVFGPDGTIVPPLVVKAFPIDEEQAFTTAGHAQELPVFNTPAGKLAVLICADSWFPEAYVHARRLGATLIAVPSFSSGDGIWQTPWAGYNGAPTASDVDRTDIGRITEGQAWLKYAMAGRAPAQGMAHGVNVFLRGTLWDLGSDGATVALQNGKALVGRVTSQAALTNLWLP